jgi:hypothetical protein
VKTFKKTCRFFLNRHSWQNGLIIRVWGDSAWRLNACPHRQNCHRRHGCHHHLRSHHHGCRHQNHHYYRRYGRCRHRPAGIRRCRHCAAEYSSVGERAVSVSAVREHRRHSFAVARAVRRDWAPHDPDRREQNSSVRKRAAPDPETRREGAALGFTRISPGCCCTGRAPGFLLVWVFPG